MSMLSLLFLMGGGVAAPPFDPSTLGVPVYAWNIQDITKLIVERTGGSTQATVGGLVGKIVEYFGSGFDAIAPSDAARGTLRQAPSGRYYLEVATDDCYQVANLPLTSRFSVYNGFKDPALSNFVFMEHSATANSEDGFNFYGSSSSAWTVRRGGVSHFAAGQANWAGTDLSVGRLTYHADEQVYYKNSLTMLSGDITGSLQAEAVATTTFNLWSRDATNVFSTADVFCTAIVSGEISSVNVENMANWVADRTCEYIFIAEGDSITASPALPDSFARLWWADFVSTRAHDAGWAMSAVGGSRQSDLRARAPFVDTFRGGSSTQAVLSVLIGAGSGDLLDYVGVLGDGLDGWLLDLAAYCDARRAKGFKVIVGTLISNSGTGFNAARNYVNPIMRTWPGVHCDAIADFAAESNMGPDAAFSDTLLFVDGVHPTALGQSHLLAVFNPVINGLLT